MTGFQRPVLPFEMFVHVPPPACKQPSAALASSHYIYMAHRQWGKRRRQSKNRVISQKRVFSRYGRFRHQCRNYFFWHNPCHSAALTQYQAVNASFFQEVHRLAGNLGVLTPNLDTKWQHKAQYPLNPVTKMGICHPRKKERKKENKRALDSRPEGTEGEPGAFHSISPCKL